MQKTVTPLNKTDLKTGKERLVEKKESEPSEETLQKIMQFASTYRVQQVAKNQYVELFLN